MEWTEITVKVPTKDLEKTEAIAQMVVSYGIYIEDYSNLEQEAMEIAHIDLIDEDLLRKDRTCGSVRRFPVHRSARKIGPTNGNSISNRWKPVKSLPSAPLGSIMKTRNTALY